MVSAEDMYMVRGKADLFADCFVKSGEMFGYNSKSFVYEVMTNPLLEDLVYYDWRQEWAASTYLVPCMGHIVPFEKGNEYLPEYELWFLGYLYKWWMYSRKMKPKEIYENLPLEAYHAKFNFYHTQGWEYVISDAIASHKRGDW